MLVAALRPESWNLPLFLHVLGAMTLVGGLIAASLAFLTGAGGGRALLVRLGFCSLLAAALPGYVLMRIGAEWTVTKEGYGEPNPDWLDIGYATSDLGVVVLLIALILGGAAVWRARHGHGSRLARVTGGLASLLLVAYAVTIWAMTAKPGS